jgi:molybdenum cofactor cytidylyltransferase
VLVAAVVLAAGSSVRMGRNKLFLEIDGETLLRRTVRQAAGAGLSPVVVVIGPEAERVRRELEGLRAIVVPNPKHAGGMNVSLRKGIEAVPQEAAAAVVLLADMPLVSGSMVEAVVHRYRESRAPLVVSRYGHTTAPPTLYDRRLFPEFGRAPLGREVVRDHWEEALVVDWPAEDLLDLDIEADYERALARLARNT